MPKPLSADVFLAALALVALDGCRSAKSDASAVPEPNASVVAAVSAAAPAPSPVSPGAPLGNASSQPQPLAGEPATETTLAATAGPVQAVEAGAPRAPAPTSGLRAAPKAQKDAPAACGAGGCSADMKKGGK